MTLIVAFKAADGVVLASDGQATVDGNLVRTRAGSEKLGDLHGLVAYGCSGHSGLQQRLARALESEVSAEQCRLPIEELRPLLHRAVNRVQKEAVAEHVPVRENSLPAHVEVLFAGHSAAGPWIYGVGLCGDDDVHPYGEAIGHARHFTAYLLVSTLHYKLQDRGVGQVRILAYRALADAIKTDATDLGPPIHLYTVTREGAERLNDARRKAIEETLNGWKQQEHDIFRGLALGEGQPVGVAAPASPRPAPGVQP
jgi:20S proteasome alpha/beta subunit